MNILSSQGPFASTMPATKAGLGWLLRGRAAAAREPHKLKVAGSNPAPATNFEPEKPWLNGTPDTDASSVPMRGDGRKLVHSAVLNLSAWRNKSARPEECHGNSCRINHSVIATALFRLRSFLGLIRNHKRGARLRRLWAVNNPLS